MAWCLLPRYRELFKALLKSGEITPDRLNAMSPTERTAFFSEKFGGEANGKQIERALESKFLNKNVEAGMVRWAEKLIDVPKEYKNDLISKIRKMAQEGGLLDMKNRETLLNELVEYRTGKRISPDEAKTITEMSAKLAEVEAKWKASEAKDAAINAEYGDNLVAYKRYIDSLESAAKKREMFSFMREEGLLGKTGSLLGDLGRLVIRIGEVSRVLKTGPDNSFFGRQFRKSWRPTTAKIALKNYGKSWVDIYQALKGSRQKGELILDAVKSDVWSRPNALKGRYSSKEGKLDIGMGEEAYPVTFIEKIPALGRLYAASRVAAEASAMRMRADIADLLYEIAEKKGRDLSNPIEVGEINKLVNSMTGRGHLKMGERAGKALNATLFSPKHLKSTIDTFTQPFTAKTAFARKQALWNTIGLAATTTILSSLSGALFPDSVETDPRSTDFGQLKFGNTRYDISGGNRGIVTLAARLLTLESKSSVTGQIKGVGEYGMPDATELITNFMENKTSPLARLTIDLLNQETSEGKPMTVTEAAKELFMPIIVQTGMEATEAEGAVGAIAATIADINGIGANSYLYRDNWETKTSKEMTGFRDKVGEAKLKEANAKYNERVAKFLNSEEYGKADNEEKKKMLNEEKRRAKKAIFFEYGYIYK